MLGRTPVQLPSPLDQLVQKLAGRRHGFTAVGREVPNRWLFAGGAPGRPLSEATLMNLAAQIPAAVLAQMLGLHPHTATSWALAAGNSRPAYAAHLSRQRP